MISSTHVLTNAHVIGFWNGWYFVDDLRERVACGWGSEEWCSVAVSWTVHPDYNTNDHFNDLAVIKLGLHPGYENPNETRPVPMALLSNASDLTLENTFHKSIGYPQFDPGTAASGGTFNLVPSASPRMFVGSVLSGDAFSQSTVQIVSTPTRGVRMKMDAMNGQSGSPIYTSNSFGIATVHALGAGFINVGTKGHRGPKIPFHRNWIVTAMGTL